ncbi:TnpV protein [Traorella massiliensis]|uniref:TnpV protein n=1 Tax=Traorella massiliensis TaxID=1903263 RepID=UPI0032B25135
MKELTYSQVEDYQLPNLKPMEKPLNSHYARLRYNYLKTNHPGHLLALKAKNELNNHLKEIDIQAKQRMEILMNQLLKKQPAPNKETHQMEWVQHMNNLKQQAEEMILNELIYN